MYRPTLAIICLSLSGFALAGCVSYYDAMSPSLATFRFSRGSMELGAKSNQEYSAYKDASCTPQPGTGRLAYLLTYLSKQKEAQVAAGSPIYLLATTALYGAAPSDSYDVAFNLTRDSCSNLVRFVPLRNHQYRLMQEASGHACSLTIIDDASNEPPPDLQELDARACSVADPNS